ncbi:putative nuclease HARBI1 [Folsomia candida]|uniref:Putative nuclease HARBI1 n=1 Tax=Folsomia candida TaxID=158441 RepID=A0A226F5R6_FOLCA|nr:putative nuclease HARBI1 [Folsomia candida]
MDRRIGTAFDRLRILERRIGRRRRIALIPHTRLRDRSDPMECFDAVQFKTRFHIFKDTALYIVDLIKGDLCAPLRRGTHIPPHIQFLIVQRFFCDGSFQLTTGDNYKVSQPTVSNLVKRVSTAIAKLRKKFIKYPTFAEAPVYNRAQIKTRNLIERAFGIWKRKFPCLKFMRLKMKTVLIVIVATAVMHNISRRRNDIFDEDNFDEEDQHAPDGNIEAGRNGRIKLREIITTHFTY